MPRKADAKMKVVKKIPVTENGPKVSCETKSGEMYIVSWCVEKMRFTLWKQTSAGYAQIGTAKSPLELYPKIPWEQ